MIKWNKLFLKNGTQIFCITDSVTVALRYSKINDSIPEINQLHFGVTVSFHCDNNLIRVLAFKWECVCGFFFRFQINISIFVRFDQAFRLKFNHISFAVAFTLLPVARYVNFDFVRGQNDCMCCAHLQSEYLQTVGITIKFNSSTTKMTTTATATTTTTSAAVTKSVHVLIKINQLMLTI